MGYVLLIVLVALNRSKICTIFIEANPGDVADFATERQSWLLITVLHLYCIMD